MKIRAKISFPRGLVLLTLLTCLAGCAQHVSSTANESKAAKSPNILWLIIDDMGLEFSCYGEELIETPNIDRLAREGTRFTNALTQAMLGAMFYQCEGVSRDYEQSLEWLTKAA